MIAIPLDSQANGDTAVLSPHGTQVTPWPDPLELRDRHRTAKLQARRSGATRPGVSSDSDRIPPVLANALWEWAWDRAPPATAEVAITLVARWEWCYWQGKCFRLPTVREYLESAAE